MVTESETDYSCYVQMLSGTGSIISLLSGFTFTAFTILLTQLSDPSGVASQFTLFFLACLFYLFMDLLMWSSGQVLRYTKNIPPLSKGTNTFNFLMLVSFWAMGTTMVLMSFIWNLIYLALATGIMWTTFMILGWVYIMKPFGEYRKTIK
jgi:hypothetical protein